MSHRLIQRVLPRLLIVMLALILSRGALAADLPVKIALQWQPQSQFAGYYMALEQGYFRQAGLDVTLVHASVENTSKDMLASGRVQAATMMLADAMAADMPMVQLLQLFQQSNLALVAWKSSGVETPSDLNGKRISLWQDIFSLGINAFMRTHAISFEPVPQYRSIELFLRHGVAATSAMEYNELNRIYLAGVDRDQLTVFMMRDYDLGIPEDGLYAMRDWVTEFPAQATALKRATIKGWAYAREHPEQTLDVVLSRAKAAGVLTNRAHERHMLNTVLASIFVQDGSTLPGELSKASFDRAGQYLMQSGLIKRVPALETFVFSQQD